MSEDRELEMDAQGRRRIVHPNVWYDKNGDRCYLDFPPSLNKALTDTFQYAVMLRGGQVIEFESAWRVGPDSPFVTLFGVSGNVMGYVSDIAFGNAPRGLDVRVSDIVWCFDTYHE